jgi:ribonuclease G
MKKADNRKLIQDIMRDEMKTDRSKFTILPLTKFGLMQITRQRVRPEMNVATHETCPSCGGYRNHHREHCRFRHRGAACGAFNHETKREKINPSCASVLNAYFTKGFPSIRMNWFLKFKTWVNIMEDSSFGITEFKFLNQNGDQIEISS